jgi:hypothetical protein
MRPVSCHRFTSGNEEIDRLEISTQVKLSDIFPHLVAVPSAVSRETVSIWFLHLHPTNQHLMCTNQ